MFTDTKAFSGFAVDDIGRAKTFYGQTLGLRTTILDRDRVRQRPDIAWFRIPRGTSSR